MKGTIHSWDNEKKYGLIQVENSQRCVVAHITAFSQKHPQPKIGEEVTFDLFANQEKIAKRLPEPFSMFIVKRWAMHLIKRTSSVRQ